ncbi:MAG: FHA domain-containing protein [Acetatifactor sp.]|nr:FHA domain-containing protein [Acetatifactor sp.]
MEKKEKRRRKTEQQEREQDIRQIYAQEPPQDSAVSQTTSPAAGSEPEDRRKGFLSFLGGRRKKQDAICYQEILQRQVSMQALGAVGEETVYGEEEEEYGRTIYLEEQQREQPRGLYRDNGELAVKIDKFPFVIGKKRDEVDYALEDRSVSRIHARILEEDGRIYLEDLNSTNGTFKNGLRMQPYEKRRLEKDDELRFGKVEYTFQ